MEVASATAHCLDEPLKGGVGNPTCIQSTLSQILPVSPHGLQAFCSVWVLKKIKSDVCTQLWICKWDTKWLKLSYTVIKAIQNHGCVRQVTLHHFSISILLSLLKYAATLARPQRG